MPTADRSGEAFFVFGRWKVCNRFLRGHRVGVGDTARSWIYMLERRGGSGSDGVGQ